MNGVEILAASEVACEFGWSWGLFLILIFLVIAFAIGAFLMNEYGGSITIIIFGLIIASIVSCKGKPIAYETQYKVTIDDSVKINEFNEKYEIVDQDGKIYIVREIKKGE